MEFPQTIIRAHGLDTRTVLEQFESYGNENWLLADGRGRYVLRRHQLNRDPSRIAFQIAFQRHLTASGIPTPAVLDAVHGQQIALDDEGIPWILYAYVTGREYDFDRRCQAVAAAHTLARLHLSTQTLDRPDAPGPEYKARLQTCWTRARQDVLELGRLFRGRGVDRELAYLAAWWDHVLAEWPTERVTRLPAGWLHGDFHGRNLIYRDDTIAAVLDFDDVDWGPYVHDVAFATVKFARTARGSLSVRDAIARVFVEAYQEVRPLSREELAALPMMMAMGHPPHPQNHWYRLRRGEDPAVRLREEHTAIERLRAEVQRLGSFA